MLLNIALLISLILPEPLTFNSRKVANRFCLKSRNRTIIMKSLQADFFKVIFAGSYEQI